jgi:hypothetical protein
VRELEAGRMGKDEGMVKREGRKKRGVDRGGRRGARNGRRRIG